MHDSAPDSSPNMSRPVRQLPKWLFGGACVATLAILVLTLSSRFRSQAEPKGAPLVSNSVERAAAEKLSPPPVPEAENFAATPFFTRLFETGSVAGSDARWPDDFSRADQWPRQVPKLAESTQGRKTGRFVTDLVAWQKSFERSQNVLKPSAERDEIVVSEQVSPAANAAAAAAVLKALNPYEPVLAELHAVRQRPQARFDVRYDWENPWGILLPHLAVVKRTTQLLRLKSSAEVAAGHSERAMADVLLMLRLADSPRQEPTLISQLVRVACLEITMQPLWEGLAARRWTEPQLQSLQTVLASFDFIGDLKRTLEAERTWGNLTIALARERRTPNFSQFLLGVEDKKGPEPWVQAADRAFETCPREWFDAEEKNYSRLYEELLMTGYDVQARRVYPRVSEENSHRLQKALSHKETLLEQHLVFAKLALIEPEKVHFKLAGAQGSADLAVVACALERYYLRHRNYPEQLSTLAPEFLAQLPHDVISGEPLHYQRTDDGRFLLYSVGWNETDDAGELGFFASGRGPEKKEGDWVWRYPMGKTAVSFE